MSASDPFKRLRDNRAALLVCEAIGWLHMAGKAHPEFVKQQASDAAKGATTWDELKWAENNVIRRFGTLPHIGQQVIEPGRLFERHRERSGGLLGLLQAAHGMASGIEKNHSQESTEYLKQTLANTWLTTPFGYPVQNLLGTSPPDVLAPGAWSNLEAKIGTFIDKLAARVKDPNNIDEWVKWRNGAIGESGWLREALTSTLAETRVPNNDVTLWDQSYIAAALFKAAVAGAVLSDNSFEWGNKIKDNTQWRVLTVGIGAEHYEAGAVRIGDWTGTRQAIGVFFDEVCNFIEVDLALGACVYRDERTLAFTFPGERFDRLGSVDYQFAQELRTAIEAHVDSLAKEKFGFETPPIVQLLCKSTRSFIAMARELTKARKVLEVPVHRPWAIESDGSNGRHVCPVTLVRPGHPSKHGVDRKQDKQDVSKKAYQRRKGRLEFWRENGGDTIWISEVADENDRVALLTFSLGLERWLDGTHVDSLRAQSVVEWRMNNPQLTVIDVDAPRDELREHVEKFAKNPVFKKDNRTGELFLSDPVLSTLNSGFSREISLKSFFEKVVEDRADAPTWYEINNDSQRVAAWLTHQLLRKNASPGRVHRFWRTAQEFFIEALEEFRSLVSKPSGYRIRRLKLELSHSGSTSNCLDEDEVYSGRLPFAPDAPFEVLCCGNHFVTVCNLARVLGATGDAAKLKGEEFDARGDDAERERFRFTIDRVEAIEDGPLATYHPLIVLEKNPERFRVLVPLEAAEKCVEHVISKWRKEMARVWDRLPLRVGVIAFPRKTPFQAVIEATRNVEDALAAGDTENWRVLRVGQARDAVRLSFERPDGGNEEVEMPTQLADGRDDVYYPNLAVVGTEPQPHDFTAPRRDGPSVVYRWAAELRKDDIVCVEPSRFAAVFLDSTARRFDPVEVHPLSEWCRRRTVWKQVLKVAPSVTAARAVEQSLREARERWTGADDTLDETAWRDWVRAVLVNEWNASGDDLKELERAACDGSCSPSGTKQSLLERVLDWHLHVLKQTNLLKRTTGATS
jgi:CRISPR-associated Csx11 family protein